MEIFIQNLTINVDGVTFLTTILVFVLLFRQKR